MASGRESLIAVATFPSHTTQRWALHNYSNENFLIEAVILYKDSKIGQASPLNDEIKIDSVKPEPDSCTFLAAQADCHLFLHKHDQELL